MLFRGSTKKLVLIDESSSEYLQSLGAVNFFLHKRDRLVVYYLSRFFSDNHIDARVGNEILFKARTYEMPHLKNNTIDVLLFGNYEAQQSVFNIFDKVIGNNFDLSHQPELSEILSDYQISRWGLVGEKRSKQGVVKGYSVKPKPIWGFIPSEKAQFNLNFMQPE